MKTDASPTSYVKLGAIIAIVLVLLSFAAMGTYTVQTGERGVLKHFGNASPRPIEPGMHFKIPMADTIETMPVTLQHPSAKADALSNDLQKISTTVVVNYYIDPTQVVKVYSTIGSTPETIEQTVVDPAVQEVMKAVTARYTAAELITQREKVSAVMSDLLRKRLAANGLIVQTFAITDFSFSPKFAEAIENKTTAEQNVLTAKQNLERAKIDNEQKVVSAQADAQATMLRAQAEANALKLQREQVSPELVQLRLAEVARAQVDVSRAIADRWNGVAPMVMGGANPLLNVSELAPAYQAQQTQAQSANR